MPVAVADQSFGNFYQNSRYRGTNFLDGEFFGRSYQRVSFNFGFSDVQPTVYGDKQGNVATRDITGTDNEVAATREFTNSRGSYSTSFFVKAGTRTTVRYGTTSTPSSYFVIPITTANTNAPVTVVGTMPDFSAYTVEKTYLGDGWYWFGLAFTLPVDTYFGFRLEMTGGTSTSNAGDKLAFFSGALWNSDPTPSMYGALGARGRVIVPRQGISDQTIRPFTSTASAKVLFTATASQTYPNYTQTANGVVYPIRYFTADQEIPAYTTNSAATLLNTLRATNLIDPFTQDAVAILPPVYAHASNAIPAFVGSDPTMPSYREAGSILVSTGATARTVPVPMSGPVKEGDAIILLAGGHSDGARVVQMQPPPGYSLIGTATGDSHLSGYRQSLMAWMKYATAEDETAQVIFNYPSNSTTPVVWARAMVVRSVGAIEAVVTEADSGSSFQVGPAISRGLNRVALSVTQSSRNLRASSDAEWTTVLDEGSDSGPTFGMRASYASFPKQASKTQSLTYSPAPASLGTISLTFLMKPVTSEGFVPVSVTAAQTIEPFISFRELFASAAQQVGPFRSSAFVNVTPLRGDQTIPALTSQGAAVAIVGVQANATIDALTATSTTASILHANGSPDDSFGAFTAGGIYGTAEGASSIGLTDMVAEGLALLKLTANLALPDFPSVADADTIVTAQGDSSFNLFLANVFKAEAAQTFDEFTSSAAGLSDVPAKLDAAQTIQAFRNTAIGFSPARAFTRARSDAFLGEFASGVVLTQIHAFMLPGRFTSETIGFSPARPFTAAESDAQVEPFTSGKIETSGQGASTIGGFSSVSQGRTRVVGTGISTIDPVIQDAGNYTFLRIRQTIEPFAANAAAVVGIRGSAMGSLGLFAAPASANTRISARGQSVSDPFSQDMVLIYLATARAQSVIEAFGSDGSAIDPDPKPTRGGVRISGRFRPFGRFRIVGEHVGKR